MSEQDIRGLVLGHGSLPDGFVDAVRQIAGSGADALTAISNRGMSPDALAEAIERHLTGEPVVLFTDLPSGSCGFAARRLCPSHPELVVVSAVNLPMLLEFVMHRGLGMQELVPRLLAKARNAVTSAPNVESYGHRAVSG